MKDQLLIDAINPTCIDLTATASNHYLSVRNTGEFRVLGKFGPGDGVQCQCDSRNINHLVNNACTDVFRLFNAYFGSFFPQAQGKKIHNICNIIRRRIHLKGMNLAMAQRHNDTISFDEDFLDYVQLGLMEKSNNSFNRLRSFFAATEANMEFSAVLPMGGSAIASSSQPLCCSDRNSISNDINNINNISRVENVRLVDGSKIVEGAMFHRGEERCQ